ncbi:MAG: T9SS type A sorting domain-containing protein [Fibromonadaceae bacterium]|jgi:hypothetical protein|nr:T9SS type A sorting domain-containing protein [Fibromonadaceae bacterium]
MKTTNTTIATLALTLLLFASVALAQTTYIITGTGAGNTSPFTVTGGGLNTSNADIQTVIDAIKANAGGNPCTIQFEDGTNTLNIGYESGIEFDGTDDAWGLITLTGKLTSSFGSPPYYRPVALTNGVSVESTADIKNTNTNESVIVNWGIGTLNIKGGTLLAMNSEAVTNMSSGNIIISGTANLISANLNAGTVVNGSSGKINITGGTVSITSHKQAVYNASTGEINISGGMIKATDGYAVYRYNGTINITGGVLFAYGTATDDVIYTNSALSGEVSISGDAAVVAWDQENGITEYTAFERDDIFAVSPATAKWQNKDGKAGIGYANGTNTGFIEIPGVTITKATAPTPTGITATVGQTLASVALPAGWSWIDATASVGAVGTQTHKAKYTPSDTGNYNTLTDISISVAVKTPEQICTESGKTWENNECTTPIRLLQIAGSSIHAYAKGNSIILQNLPANVKVEVYNLNGKRIYSAHPENPIIGGIGVQTIAVQTKGMYIVKVGRGVSNTPNTNNTPSVFRVAVK